MSRRGCTGSRGCNSLWCTRPLLWVALVGEGAVVVAWVEFVLLRASERAFGYCVGRLSFAGSR